MSGLNVADSTLLLLPDSFFVAMDLKAKFLWVLALLTQALCNYLHLFDQGLVNFRTAVLLVLPGKLKAWRWSRCHSTDAANLQLKLQGGELPRAVALPPLPPQPRDLRGLFSVSSISSDFFSGQLLDLSMGLVPRGGSFPASDSGGCSGRDLTEHSGISPSPRTRSVKLYIIMMNRTFWCMQKL